MSTPNLSAHTPSWSTAAALNVSPAASIIFLPSFWSRLASFAIVVVFPAPLTPTTRMTQMSSVAGVRGTCTSFSIFRMLSRSTPRSLSASVSPLATKSLIGSSSTVVVEIPTSAINNCSSSSSMVSSSTSPVISRLNCCCMAFLLLLRALPRDWTRPASAATMMRSPVPRRESQGIDTPILPMEFSPASPFEERMCMPGCEIRFIPLIGAPLRRLEGEEVESKHSATAATAAIATTFVKRMTTRNTKG
mmetsp:Transcript_4709/g.6673  ORF Transcript_4709/g.6673 Transcript_4709/m.6673 type:complete len:248 (+) Transcript_4709:994-1737(+)